MNWKKFLLIAIVAGGFAFVSAPRSEAGISVGIGIGVPVAYPYPYGYYRYGCHRPYGYYRSYYRPHAVVYVGPHYYWSHGHRAWCSRHHHHRHWR